MIRCNFIAAFAGMLLFMKRPSLCYRFVSYEDDKYYLLLNIFFDLFNLNLTFILSTAFIFIDNCFLFTKKKKKKKVITCRACFFGSDLKLTFFNIRLEATQNQGFWYTSIYLRSLLKMLNAFNNALSIYQINNIPGFLIWNNYCHRHQELT